ncbi:MAG: DUF3943 domain-containing protein [Massilia sp.]
MWNNRAPRWLAGASLLALAAAGAARAQAGPSLGKLLLSEAALQRAVERGEAPGRGGAQPAWYAQEGPPYKGYGAAALQILGFQFALNRFDNAFVGPEYHVSLSSIGNNLHSSWVEDRDPFQVNQLGHPYQGSVYFGLARSNGLNFWESLGYAFVGSAVWEIAGETTRPSRNDQITTSFGGAFLGEALYRMAQLVLEQGYGLSPPWREGVAAALSPPLGFNRYVRPGHGSGMVASRSPPTFARLQLGASTTSHANPGPSLSPKRNEYAADFLLEYGLPGKPGYEYRRPFDYFNFHLRISNVQGVESLQAQGLLFGAAYGSSPRVRGIWGLYGSYEYLSPQLFRVASSALTLGSNAQWRLTDSVALQGHASAGIGYTSTGTVKGSPGRQYNYGFAPQAMQSLRLILGEQLALDLTAREYFNGRLTSPETGGTDRVVRADASLTYQLQHEHAIALKYITSRRSFSFPQVLQLKQRRDSIGLYYVYQPTRGFGAVRW